MRFHLVWGCKCVSAERPKGTPGCDAAPAGLMMSDGYLQADFAIRRSNFNLYKLPGTPPDFVKADHDPMPARDATPNMPALKALLTRQYKGFELPASLR